MNSTQIYIAVAIVVLAVIALAILFLRKDKKDRKISQMTWLAFAFILAGIVFSDEKWVGYSLIGVGVILSVVDIIIKSKRK